MDKGKSAIIRGHVRPLPVSTFGEMAELGYELHVWCQRCKTPRRAEITSALWARSSLALGFDARAFFGVAGLAAGPGCCPMRPPVRAAVGNPRSRP